MDENKNNGRKKKIIIIAIILLLLTALILGAFYLKKKVNKESQLVGDVNKEVLDSASLGINLQEEIIALNLQYKDAIAWLMIPGTSIDMPIFQSTDNNRYIRTDRDNNKTNWGETFMDYRSNINNMDNMSNLIIYGHNTEVDSYFTPLMNYKDKDFLEKHKTIEMSTINGNYKWEIFSIYVTDIDFFYIDTVFADKTDFGNYLDTVKGKSIFDTKVTVTNSDTILTLSTCDYTRTNGRFVVQAKLVK